MRVLLVTIGTAGDVHPFIAVGRALRRAGHEPVVVANPYFQPRIVGAGLGFWPLGDEASQRALARDPGLVSRRTGPRVVLKRLIVPGIGELVTALTDAARVFAPEIILAHHLCLAAPGACARLGIPCVTAALAPMMWLSQHEPIAYPQLSIEELPRRVDWAYRRLIQPLGRLKWDWPINRALGRAGLPAMRDIAFTSARGGDHALGKTRPPAGTAGIGPVLGLWSPLFRPGREDDPLQSEICGFTSFDPPRFVDGTPEAHAESTALRELFAWMDQGSRPVLVSFGSSVSHHAGRVYARAAAALAGLGLRGVFLTGSGEFGAAHWGEHVRAAAFVPYELIMHRASCVVHHGGIGTIASALRAGAVQVIVPCANDEFDNAARVRRLGVGVRVKGGLGAWAGGGASTGALQSAISEVVRSDGMRERAREMARELRREDGAIAAAKALERIVTRLAAVRILKPGEG